MSHKEKARELFLKGYNCAQAVFAAFGDVTGLNDEQALLISSSFGGGMGHIGEACGAVSGMLMAAGMLFGFAESATPELKKEHYKTVRELTDEFKERFGALRCPELLAKLGKGEYEVPEDEIYKKRPCLIFVEKAADILDEMLKKEQNQNGTERY